MKEPLSPKPGCPFSSPVGNQMFRGCISSQVVSMRDLKKRRLAFGCPSFLTEIGAGLDWTKSVQRRPEFAFIRALGDLFRD
jgi:hypothetical protein